MAEPAEGKTSIIVCGVDRGPSGRWRCCCCGHESDDIEDFAPGSFCWDCCCGHEDGKLPCPKRGVDDG